MHMKVDLSNNFLKISLLILNLKINPLILNLKIKLELSHQLKIREVLKLEVSLNQYSKLNLIKMPLTTPF